MEVIRAAKMLHRRWRANPDVRPHHKTFSPFVTRGRHQEGAEEVSFRVDRFMAS
jgi:hypothetical protein